MSSHEIFLKDGKTLHLSSTDYEVCSEYVLFDDVDGIKGKSIVVPYFNLLYWVENP
jgi:hypothetical protein